MSFVQAEYPVFLAIVFAVYWALGRRNWQNGWLLAASLVFYGWFHAWFVALMLGAAMVDFGVAQAIERWPDRRRWLVAVSVGLNLSMLGYFKYTNFFADQIVGLLQGLGFDARWSGLDVLLPVGISFYTFQTIGYTVDVARGELRARKDLVAYLLYVSLFAQLVAGPIERAGRLLPQIERDRVLGSDAVRSAVSLGLWGAFKKLVVADSIAPYVDKVFVLEHPAAPLVWAASAAFMIQIYADFSGYTDMARGSARLLGFELGANFREPFLARTTVEFWQRWHISLSTWLRDYLLGPLVGDAGAGRLRFAVATVVTFVVIGFWHGPSWNFVLFGLYQGLWVVAYGLGTRALPAWTQRIQGRGASPWGPFGSALAVGFHLVAVGLVGTYLFRERHLDRIVYHFARNPFFAYTDAWIATIVVVSVTAACSVPLIAHWGYGRWVRPRIASSPLYLPFQTTAWALVAAALFLFYRTTLQDFVYFQF